MLKVCWRNRQKYELMGVVYPMSKEVDEAYIPETRVQIESHTM